MSHPARRFAPMRPPQPPLRLLAQVGSARRHSAPRGDSAVRERQTARGCPTTPAAATVRRRFAARSYLVLVGSAELAPHSPGSIEVARRVATMRHRSAVWSYLVLAGSAELAELAVLLPLRGRRLHTRLRQHRRKRKPRRWQGPSATPRAPPVPHQRKPLLCLTQTARNHLQSLPLLRNRHTRKNCSSPPRQISEPPQKANSCDE